MWNNTLILSMYVWIWMGYKQIKRKWKKHKVSFIEAVSVFGDPLAIYFDDEEHSTFEQRNKIIGISSQGKAIVVVYTERGNIIRIISSRLLTLKERKNFENKRK